MKSVISSSFLCIGLIALLASCNTRPEPVFPAVNSSALQNVSEYLRADINGKAWDATASLSKSLNPMDSTVSVSGNANNVSINFSYRINSSGGVSITALSFQKDGSSYFPVTTSVGNVFSEPNFVIKYPAASYLQYNAGSFAATFYNTDGNFVSVTNGAFYLKF